ncbi:osmoprotectant transport system substrate-binding protein [Geothermobacter ehrlichii]|uniref:Osmoprotectant transport system substrate-binding protein n=2 Tax=Geothermobacter ehrlichii TaxID=213224 RepID=A0A5D3WGE7_9BACT|nr:osmoprotectant transport system substrate-binding protein [Geothermobacter ehrlichii]
MIRLRVFFLPLLLLVFLWVPVLPASACVGKTLVIGATEEPQQQVLAQLLAVLISERTGTTVKIVRHKTHRQLHEALLRAELDMYVEYTGVGQVEILGRDPISDPKALYAAVKQSYNSELNLIWLKPFGFDAPGVAPADVPAEAAPVVRKDTLKKFPALARLINKLGGRIDLATIRRLEDEAASRPPEQVARNFLKANRLI